MRPFSRRQLASVLILCAVSFCEAGVSLHLPLARTAYQCNEEVPVTILRSGGEAWTGGALELALIGEDGSSLGFTFPVKAVESRDDRARSVEHLRVNGWLLRPGSYRVEASFQGAVARTNISLHSSIRRSEFKLINWGRAKGNDLLAQGEDGLGFNLFLGQGDEDKEANLIRAGLDFVSCCTMSGGHQMDLRPECDWSDPYVIRGGARRVTRRAFIDRTRPNVPGVHFYDEPGLTWARDKETGETSPHAVPWQHRSYEAAFGVQPPDWKRLDPSKGADAAGWAHWARWKLAFMDAAWKDAQFGVLAVEPEYLGITQSQYGYSAFCDGYYFNVVRSLPITSGHGGYHDYGPGYFNPSMFLEFARARDLAKPCWYLPTWYSTTTADQFRLEQYLAFQCGLQGMISPPDIDPGGAPAKSPAAQGVVESNHLLQRIGPIFNHITPTRPPVALLYSLSQFIHTQTLDRKVNYAHDTAHGRNVMFTYLAGKLLQHQFAPVLDEDILDGTLATHHRAVILTSIDYLEPDVLAALERFAGGGGLVLLTSDSTVAVRGATRLEVAPEWPDARRISELKQAGRNNEAGELMRLRQALAGAAVLADAIRPPLRSAGIEPPLTSTRQGLVVTRHVSGDIEYLFAVNATHDPRGNPMLGMRAVAAELKFPHDGRTVYDAIRGGKEPALGGGFAFGPGQMRVFARAREPIDRLSITAPELHRDYVLQQSPVSIDFAVSVLDIKGAVVNGAIPLRVTVTDPLGHVRYDLYRATDQGTLRLRLPLALNDPPGDWKVAVVEQLGMTAGERKFTLPSFSSCSSAAGKVGRAAFWPSDRERVFRFFRTHHQVTLVVGTNRHDQLAAGRLERILKPWNIDCRALSGVEASASRALTEDEALTWVGLDYAGRGQIRPGNSNAPAQSGFAVRGPVILLGNPADNPLIDFLVRQRFLPYQLDGEFMPGPGRGLVAWQREAMGVNQESIALIANDEAGMDEAVGTLYEMMAGLEPLTPLVPARTSVVQPATRPRIVPDLVVNWTALLEDRITALRVSDGGLTVLTAAGTRREVRRDGSFAGESAVPEDYESRLARFVRQNPEGEAAARKPAAAGRLIKLAADSNGATAVAYWGGLVEVLDQGGKVVASHRCAQDITALDWLGANVVLGDADGRLMCLRVP
jgi:hypothetical protein